MARKLTRVLALVAFYVPMSVLALGLGDISLNSALNQPLSAEIRLFSVEPGGASDIRVNLAPEINFEQAGIDRVYLLTKLIFTLKEDGDRVSIKVTSKEAIREPFLDFMVEVDWPKGRLVRQYTLLLDPPREAIAPTLPLPQIAAAEDFSFKAGSEYRVQPGETLWEISLRARPNSSVSARDTMTAIYNANPKAFINGNVNALRSGVVLRIPDGASVSSPPPSPVAQPQPEFDEPKITLPSSTKPDPVEQDRQITIQRQQDELRRKREELLQIRLQLEEVEEAKNKALEARKKAQAKQNKIIAEQQAQQQKHLAKIQALEEAAKQAKQRAEQQMASVDPITTTKPPPPVKPVEPPFVEEPTLVAPTEPPFVKEPISVEPTTEPPFVEEPTLVEPAEPPFVEEPTLAAPTEPLFVEEPTSVEPTVPSFVDPAPIEPTVATTTPTTELLIDKDGSESFFSSVAGILVLGGGALLLVGGMVFLLMRRKGSGSDEIQESILASEETDISTAELSESDTDSPGGEESSFLSDFTPSDIEAIQTEAGEVDPLSEADVYIAYGKYQQAEDLIKLAIENKPERTELKLKLFEIYHVTKNAQAFEEKAERYAPSLKNNADAWSKVVAIGSELAPSNPLFGGGGLTTNDSNLESEDEISLSRLDGDIESGADSNEEADFDNLNLDLGSLIDEPSETSPDLTPVEDSGAQDTVLDLDLEEPLLEDDDDAPTVVVDMNAITTAPTAEMPVVKEPEPIEEDVALDMDLEGFDGLAEVEDGATSVNVASDIDQFSDLEDEGLTDLDEVGTKLDLARAYADMGDAEGAKSILEEVLEEGTDAQKQEAKELADQLSG